MRSANSPRKSAASVRNTFQVLMNAVCEWQDTWLAEVADEIVVGDTAVDCPLDIRMRLGQGCPRLGQTSL